MSGLWLHVGIGDFISIKFSQVCKVVCWQQSTSAAPQPCDLRQDQQPVVMDAPPLFTHSGMGQRTCHLG